MLKNSANPPVVLSFSVLDPSGAGGIQADIETAASIGCHCAPIVTSMCVDGFAPDTETLSMDTTLIIEQARSVLENMDVLAVKVGFLGSPEMTETVHTILQDYNQLPVVSHPVLSLLDYENPEHLDLVQAYRELILPLSTIANFSLFEAREVSKESDTIDTTAHAIIASGCETAFISGTGKHTQAFQNSAYGNKGLLKNYHWQQEPPACLGSSSTLSMSMAAYMAHGFDQLQAIEQAQNFTWQAMRAARELGFNRHTPHRFFWADKNIESAEDAPPGLKSH